MKIPIFTISRQFGSGGRTVGKRMAERLAIPCYDQELIEKITEESGFTREFVERSGEQMRYSRGLLVPCRIGISMAIPSRMICGRPSSALLHS